MGNKKNETKLSPQETLIAYCSTLSSKKAKEAYQILLERFEIHRARVMTFTREGTECPPPNGKIRLTPSQYETILSNYGEQGFHELCEILYDYIIHLEERAECEAIARKRLREYQKISHYYKLTKGWVAQRYEEAHPNTIISLENKPLDFFDIDTKAKAIEYIKSIPNELRFDNKEIAYLIMEYKLDEKDIKN